MAAWSFTHGDTLSEAAGADADGAAPALIGRDGSRCADAGRDHRRALLPACRRSTLSAPADAGRERRVGVFSGARVGAIR